MAKRITPGRAYQSRSAPLRQIMDARVRPLERDLKAALQELSRRMPREEMIRLARAGRWFELKSLVDLRHFRGVMRAPFDRIAQTYEAAALLGTRQINGKLHRHSRPVRYRKFDPDQPRDDIGRWTDGGTGHPTDDDAMDAAAHALGSAAQEITRDMFPDGFDTSENAPNTFEDLVKQFHETGRLTVYSGASDKTIFGSPEANYAFRAWHDALHLRLMAPFTPEGEHRVMLAQAHDVMRRYGNSPETRAMVRLLHAEIDGQVKYSQAHNGEFPVDQRAFDMAFMRRGDAAAHDTFKAKQDRSWGRLRDTRAGLDHHAFQPSRLAHEIASTIVAKYSPEQERDWHGRWTTGGAGTIFASPQTGSTDFDGAVQALASERQDVLAKAYADVDKELGLEAHQRNVIGAWHDGAENSTMAVISRADWETLRASGAMKGYLGDQRAVLVFQSGEGHDFLASFKVEGTLADIHTGLLAKGLEFHTLEPTHGGARVHVFGSGQEQLNQIGRVAIDYGTKARVEIGRGEFVGTNASSGSDAQLRADARQHYQSAIELAGGHDPRIVQAWDRLRDRWGAATQALKVFLLKFDPAQPRDWRGRWTDTGAGDADPAAQAREWIAQSNLQTIEQVVAAAPENQKRLQEIGREIADMLPGVEFKPAGIKTADEKGIRRVMEKAQTRGIPGVTDVIRIGFVISNPSEKQAIVDGLRRRYEVIDEGFQRNLYGYMDSKALIRMRDGQIGEIQIMERNIALAKSSHGKGAGGGHKLYDEARSLPVTSPVRTSLMKQSQAIYGNAIKRAGADWVRLYDLAPLKKFVMGLLLDRPDRGA